MRSVLKFPYLAPGISKSSLKWMLRLNGTLLKGSLSGLWISMCPARWHPLDTMYPGWAALFCVSYVRKIGCSIKTSVLIKSPCGLNINTVKRRSPSASVRPELILLITLSPVPLRTMTPNLSGNSLRHRGRTLLASPHWRGTVGFFSDGPSKADILNSQFSSVFSRQDISHIPSLAGPKLPDISGLTITVNGVTKLLSNVKPNKATGPDNLSCRLLKEASNEIAPILTDIFNSSLSSGTLPSDWKKARVAPVFKKGNTNDAANYRPISLTCVCTKLMEHIICHHVRGHLDHHSILSKVQHGFRTGHSCVSQLLNTVQDLMVAYDKHKQIDVAVLDFSKAFDVVPHQRLLGKLQHYGINGHILKWISEFLSSRTQCVVVDGAASSWSAVESGVPQGTVLGPLLFLLYINVLPDCVESQVRLFAYDCLLYRTIEGIPDQLALQSDLTKLQQWADLWGMQFNPGKCTILTTSHGTPKYQKFHTLCGQILQHTSEAKYLGVTLSSDLHWSKHIQDITSKSSSTLGLLHRNLSGCPIKLREEANIALIRSRLEYCSAVWDPHLKKDINSREAVQRRAARFTVQDYRYSSSVSAMLSDLNWLLLKDRRKDIRLALLFQIIRGKISAEAENILLKPDSRTRKKHNSTYRLLRPHTEQYRQSFFVTTIIDWNNLSEACVNADTITAFKAQLRPLPHP